MRARASRIPPTQTLNDNDMSTLTTVQEMLMAEFELTADKVMPEANLASLGIDSLATLEFLFKLEEKFELDLNNDPTPVNTVADIASEVDRLLTQKAAGAA